MDTTSALELRADALRLIDQINLIYRELDGFSRYEILNAVRETADIICSLRGELVDDPYLRGKAIGIEDLLRQLYENPAQFSEGEMLGRLTVAQSVLRRLLSATVSC